MPICIHCGKEKDQELFAKRGLGYRNACKICNNAKRLEWNKKNPEKRKEISHRHYAKKTGKSPDQLRVIKLTDEERKARKRESGRKNYIKNKQLYLERARKRYSLKKQEISEYTRTWRQENKEYKAQKDMDWRSKNLPKVNAYSNKRRAKKLNATPPWLDAIQLAQIQEMYDVALACTTQTGVKHHVDHIHPLQGKNFSGLHVPWNLRVISASENLSKGNCLPLEDVNLSWESA